MRRLSWSQGTRRFGTILREGADATSASPILEFVADVVGVGLLSLNTLLGIAMLPWSSRKVKASSKDSPHQIWVKLNSDFRYVDMSPEFCKLLGFSRDQLIGRSAEDVTPHDFTNIEAVREEIRRDRKKSGFWLYQRSDRRLVLVRYAMVLGADNMADLVVAPVNLAA